MAATAAGPTSLPDHAPGMVHSIRGVSATVGALAIIVCCARLYVRRFITRSFGLDDYLVIIALILVLLFIALGIIITYYGVGYHQSDVPLDKLLTMTYIAYVSQCGYLFVALSVKASLCVFIIRIFPTKPIRWIGWGTIIFMVLMTISGELPIIFQCKPVAAAYDKTIPGFKCFGNDVIQKLQLYQAILMFIFDIIIIVMPMPTIWKLHMPVNRRLVIMGLFALGLVACAAGLARIPLLGYQTDASDFTYSAGIPLILMNTEFCLGLITGSLPSLRIMFRFIPGLGSSNKSSNHRSHEWASGPDSYQLSSHTQNRWSRRMLGKNRPNDAVSVASESEERIFPTVKSSSHTACYSTRD